MQGLGKPLGVKGKGQEGKGQDKDFMTLNKPLPFWRVRGFPKTFIPQISKCSKACMFIKIEFNQPLKYPYPYPQKPWPLAGVKGRGG